MKRLIVDVQVKYMNTVSLAEGNSLALQVLFFHPISFHKLTLRISACVHLDRNACLDLPLISSSVLYALLRIISFIYHILLF
jgi:hypothetical protein